MEDYYKHQKEKRQIGEQARSEVIDSDESEDNLYQKVHKKTTKKREQLKMKFVAKKPVTAQVQSYAKTHDQRVAAMRNRDHEQGDLDLLGSDDDLDFQSKTDSDDTEGQDFANEMSKIKREKELAEKEKEQRLSVNVQKLLKMGAQNRAINEAAMSVRNQQSEATRLLLQEPKQINENSNRNKGRIEQDQLKWAGTGLENIFTGSDKKSSY